MINAVLKPSEGDGTNTAAGEKAAVSHHAPLSVLGLLFLMEGGFKAAPEGMAASGFPLAAPHHLGLALADLTHQCSEHLVDVIAERRGGLEKRALELPRQLFALLYRHLNV